MTAIKIIYNFIFIFIVGFISFTFSALVVLLFINIGLYFVNDIPISFSKKDLIDSVFFGAFIGFLVGIITLGIKYRSLK
jgi:hypothetical protein